jgi:phenylpropionate dioxygenase-like ring-hydroxylating dioxygenase large terminal subunit
MEVSAKVQRWAAEYPELGTGPVPIEPCVSPAYFERERERLFRCVWLNVGRADEIPQAGDYFVRELAVGNTSLLVVRGKDGEIRAFHNMCSHRGNKVVWDTRGSCQALSCKFHGWTYNLAGQLTVVPDEERFADLKKEENGLTLVATAVWEGFIFINLDPTPQETLSEYLGELGERMQGYPFDKLTAHYSYQAEIKVNWKVALNAFPEGYHLAFIHRRSVSDTFTSNANALCRPLWIKLYPRHHTFSVHGNPQHQPTAVEALSYRYGALISQGAISKDRLPSGVNPSKSPDWSFDINIFFPNFLLAVSAGWYFTYHFWPLAVDRTLFVVRNYYLPPENAGQRFSQEYSIRLFRDALLEDLGNLEQVQSVLASGAKTVFHLQDDELCVRYLHKVVEDHVGFYRAS